MVSPDSTYVGFLEQIDCFGKAIAFFEDVNQIQ